MRNKKESNSIIQRAAYGVIRAGFACLFLLLVWVIAERIVGNKLLLPNVLDCLKETGNILTSNIFWLSFLHTMLRVFLAFGISFIVALIFAFVSYLLPAFDEFFSPIVSFLRSLPTLAVLLILLIWSGAEKAPIAVAFLSLFPMLYAGIFAGLSQTDKGLIQMSKAYQVPLKKRIFQLYLPSCTPYICKEAGAALGFSLKLVVSAEVLASTYNSLGGMMQEAKLYFEMPRLFALVGISFIVGMLLELLGSIVATLLKGRRV